VGPGLKGNLLAFHIFRQPDIALTAPTNAVLELVGAKL